MIGSPLVDSRSFFVTRPATPLGRLELAGYYKDTWRSFDWPMRRLTCYAFIFVLDGGGRYRDSLGSDIEIQEGDLILLFPDIPHGYGPTPGKKWSEMFAHFEGPAIDTWRASGLLNPEKPVFHLKDPLAWRARLDELFRREIEGDKAALLVQLSDFLAALTAMISTGAALDKDNAVPRWLQSAFDSLDPSVMYPDLHAIANMSGMPYNTFRKRFKAETGESPAHYRNRLQLEAARSLLIHTNITMREIALSLNFNDEFHFSNRFHSAYGLRPSVYRRKLRDGEAVRPHREPSANNPAYVK